MTSAIYREGSTWDTKSAKAREEFLATIPYTKWRVGRAERNGIWASYYEIEDEIVMAEFIKRFPPDRLWDE